MSLVFSLVGIFYKKGKREEGLEYNYPDKNDVITSKIINKSKGYQKYWQKSENRILRNIERNLKSNGGFLDVGCGYGRMLEKLEKYFSDIVGIEPDRNRSGN